MFYQPAIVIGEAIHGTILGTRNEINEIKAMAQAALVFPQNTIQWFPAKFI